MRKILGVLAAALLSAAALRAAADSGADFLLLEPSALAGGLGGAETATGGQLEALRYNPAGLSGLGSLNLAVSEMNTQTDENDSWAALGGRVGPVFVAGELLVDSEAPFTLYNAAGQSYGSANVGSQNLGLGAALPATNWLHLGADVRYFRSQLATYSSQGFGMDLGAQVRTPGCPVSGGLAVQNLGVESAYISQSDPLPLLVRIGVQGDFDLYDHYHLSPRADVVDYQDSSRAKELRLGIEGTLYQYAFVRAGWIQAGGLAEPALGLGIQWQNLVLDYAYQPGNVLGPTQLVELRFNRP